MYDVSEEAPGGECRYLNPKNVKVVDENMEPLDVISVSILGEFCFKGNGNEDET